MTSEQLKTLDSQKTNFVVLKRGSTGDEVTQLQENLIALNYLIGKPDNYFGINTERAVKNFQKDNKLLESGIVDRNLWRLIQLRLEAPISVSEPTIKEGDKNNYVKRAQLRLQVLNLFNGQADGIFGSDTTKAVEDFQRSRNLPIDGIIGPDTWRALNRAFAASETPIPIIIEPMAEGSEGEMITILQRALNILGYHTAEVTGIFDLETTKSVENFQRENNLEVTGIVDQRTWEALEQRILRPNTQFQVLEEGKTGSNVIILQEKLKLLNLFPGSITGSFGPETTQSVKEFQRNNNLEATGIVDRKTWELLFDKTNNSNFQTTAISSPYVNRAEPLSVLDRPTLRLGDTGTAVTELQTILKQLMYYDGPINGIFDGATNVAVRTFQTNNALTADGVVARSTWSALIYLYSPLAICGTGSTAKFVGVVIDPGHGGTDPGAVGNEIIEKEYNLRISQYMANRFRELGVPFAMTRDSDETLSREERIRRMKAPFGDVSNAIVISNHINAGGGEGAEVVYALRNTPVLAQKILDEIGNAGQKKRSVYQKRLPEDPTKDYYYIMRDTNNLQTTLVEYGFLDNANDVLRLQKYWDKYAEATVKAVTEYMGYTYTSPEAGKATYVVQAGDTLYSIANKFNTTVDEIKRLNNLTSNTITVGQQLIISGTGVTPTPPSGNIVYIVKAGDTLWNIASRFDTTVANLKSLNNLTNDALTIGQQLFVPGVSIETPETSPTVYTVQSGDTLYSIAAKFNTTVANLRNWNNLTSDILTVGQRLIVAQGGQPSYITYIVVSGDSLWSIANRFGTTVDAIKQLNGLTTNNLSIGQQLLIPSNGFLIYTVVSGDSLWNIANRFGTTVDAIKQLNGLSNNLLTIGQQLKIPS